MGNSHPRQLQQANQPLLQAIPPPPMPLQSAQSLSQISSTVTIKSESSVDRNSLALSPGEQGDVQYLEATYSAHQDSVLTVHYFCNEIQEPTGLRVFRSNPAYFPAPLELQLPRGYHQPLPAQSIPINFAQHTGLLAFQDPTVYPVVLELRPLDVNPPQCHVSLICFVQDAGQWKVKLLQQRLYAHQRYFVLHEMFGVQRQHLRDEETPECVVCMTDRKNTAVLPCRHMCLCGSCANIVRSQPTSKCPICRCQVDCLLQLVVET